MIQFDYLKASGRISFDIIYIRSDYGEEIFKLNSAYYPNDGLQLVEHYLSKVDEMKAWYVLADIKNYGTMVNGVEYGPCEVSNLAPFRGAPGKLGVPLS